VVCSVCVRAHSENVSTAQNERNGLSLDGRGQRPAELFHALDDLRKHTQLGEFAHVSPPPFLHAPLSNLWRSPTLNCSRERMLALIFGGSSTHTHALQLFCSFYQSIKKNEERGEREKKDDES